MAYFSFLGGLAQEGSVRYTIQYGIIRVFVSRAASGCVIPDLLTRDGIPEAQVRNLQSESISGETAVIFCLAEENTFVPSDSQLKAVTGNKVGSASFESYSNRLFSHSIGSTTSNVHLPRSIFDQIDLHRHQSDVFITPFAV